MTANPSPAPGNQPSPPPALSRPGEGGTATLERPAGEQLMGADEFSDTGYDPRVDDWEDEASAAIIEVLDRRQRNASRGERGILGMQRNRMERRRFERRGVIKKALQAADKENKAGSLQDFLAWLLDNQDKIIAFIKAIIGLFSPTV